METIFCKNLQTAIFKPFFKLFLSVQEYFMTSACQMLYKWCITGNNGENVSWTQMCVSSLNTFISIEFYTIQTVKAALQ